MQRLKNIYMRKYNPEEKKKTSSFPLAELKSVYLRLPSKKVKDDTFNPRAKIRNSILTKRKVSRRVLLQRKLEKINRLSRER